MYYSIISLFFAFGGSYLSGYSTNIDLNNSDLTSSEGVEDAGLFSTGVSLGRFFGFVAFGIGLPADTPAWFSIIFFIMQTGITIFTAGFVISSIWNG